jgi:hypothetical protein
MQGGANKVTGASGRPATSFEGYGLWSSALVVKRHGRYCGGPAHRALISGETLGGLAVAAQSADCWVEPLTVLEAAVPGVGTPQFGQHLAFGLRAHWGVPGG